MEPVKVQELWTALWDDRTSGSELWPERKSSLSKQRSGAGLGRTIISEGRGGWVVVGGMTICNVGGVLVDFLQNSQMFIKFIIIHYAYGKTVILWTIL